MSASLEAFLARLYVDQALRERFLADPHRVAAEAGLDEATQSALSSLDPVGLELAARSFARKRAHKLRATSFARRLWNLLLRRAP